MKTVVNMEKLATKAMEIAAHDSVDHDGKRHLRVGAWLSDRDANLTSGRAVADMLARRIEHRMTAADAKNQTPKLDNAMRQVQEMALAIRLEAGLPPEYWEFAVSFAVMTINRLGVGPGADELGRSPMTRWTGRATSIDGWHIFGCEVFVEEKAADREHGKLGAVAPGGDGRRRYLGPDRGAGFISMGHRVIDTVPPGGGLPRVRAVKSCKFNEEMDLVRKLPYPRAACGSDDNEEWYDDRRREGRSADEEQIDREAELRKLLDDLPAGPVGGDDDGAKEGKQFPSQPSEKRAKPGVGKRARTGAISGQQTKKVRKPLMRLAKWDENKKIRCVQENPKTKGTMCYDRYDKYKVAKTVREYHTLGGTKNDLRFDRRKGYVVATRPTKADEAAFAASGEADVKWVGPVAARERYAQQAEMFHAERAAGGVELPDDLPYNVTMLPFWDAAVAAEPELDAALDRVRVCAQEAAMWELTRSWTGAVAEPDGDETEKDDTGEAEKDEVDEQIEKYRRLAEETFAAAAECYSASVEESLKHRRAVDVPTPRTYDEAMKGEFKKEWLAALESELENLRSHKVYVWVPRPAGVKVLDSNWAWRVKPADDGTVAKLKVRLVGRGFREIYGVHFFETFAPVGKLATFRFMCSEVARRGMKIKFLDIRSAYLKADAPVAKYMSVPKGVTPPKPGLVWLLKKAIYGMRDSAAAWHKQFRADLLGWGFKACASDPCLFLKREGNDIMRVLLFVDDLAIAVDKTPGGAALEKWLEEKINEKYEFSSSPDDNVYLGMTLERTAGGHLVLTQRAYIERMMTKLGFENCRTAWTPSAGGKVSVEGCRAAA